MNILLSHIHAVVHVECIGTRSARKHASVTVHEFIIGKRA